MNRYGSMFVKKHSDQYAVKRHLTHFVRQSSLVDQEAFGEIMFVEDGRKPTYSPYFTLSAKADPSVLWTLFTHYWRLFVPQVIISTMGEFETHDEHWRHISKQSWILTKGSSPVSSYKDKVCIIAVQKARDFEGWRCLHSKAKRGLFPARYIQSPHGNDERFLDSDHTHFVFVDGTDEEVLDFRKQLLAYLGSKPIEFDSTRTKFTQIPVIIKVTGDSLEELLHAAQCIENNHIVIVNKKAKNIVALLKKRKKKNVEDTTEHEEEGEEQTAYVSLRAFLRKLKSKEDMSYVREFFKHSHKHNLMIYPSPSCASLKEAIISAMTQSSNHCHQTILRLALIWGKVEMISNFFKQKSFKNDDVFSSSCLQLALTLDRGDFLELLCDSGINVYSSLTTRSLWNLYFKEISAQIPTSSAAVLRHFLKKKTTELNDMLQRIGSLISELTSHECENIYDGSTYIFEGAREFQDGSAFVRNLVVDKSYHLPHATRDLFIWCIFTEHNELAKVLWKHGNEQMVYGDKMARNISYIFVLYPPDCQKKNINLYCRTSYPTLGILASVLYSAQAAYIDRTSELTLSTDHLVKYSREWEDRAVKFLQSSCKSSEAASQSQLTSLIPHLGNCSCITLAHGGKRYSFMATGALQRIMDAVWVGSSRFETPLWLVLLAMFLPILIPFVNITRQRSTFSFFSNQVYHPFFSDQPADRDRANLKTIFRRNKAGGVERQNSENISFSLKIWCRQSYRDIESFYVSPRITFLAYIIFLLLTIFVMSATVVTMNIYRFRITKELHVYWLVWYMLGMMAEELRRLVTFRAQKFRTKLRLWLSNVWTIVDLSTITCYFTGLIVFWFATDQSWWYISKVLFSITLIFLYVQALKAYTVSKLLGPILQMILRMIGDLLAFLAIVGLLFWAYGIVLHSLENEPMPTSDVNRTVEVWGETFGEVILGLINYVGRKPFWQIFGDVLGNSTQMVETIPDFIRSLLTAVYVCFTTILLLNLLIAMLSNTYQNVQDHSYQVWAFYRYQTVQGFADRPCLPSPFILLIHIVRIIRYIIKRTPTKCAFKKAISSQELELSREFDADVLSQFLDDDSERNMPEIMMKEIYKTQEEMKDQMTMLLNEDDMSSD